MRAIIVVVMLLCACTPRVPEMPELPGRLQPVVKELPLPMLHADGVGSIPAVSVTLSTLTWLIRGLFLAAAAATVGAALSSAVPFFGRIGWKVLGRIAGACAGTAIACLVLSYAITRVVFFIDRHPIVSGLAFFGSLIAIAGVWVWGHINIFERWFNVDVDRDGDIGEK